jgi:hypothetical protein
LVRHGRWDIWATPRCYQNRIARWRWLRAQGSHWKSSCSAHGAPRQSSNNESFQEESAFCRRRPLRPLEPLLLSAALRIFTVPGLVRLLIRWVREQQDVVVARWIRTIRGSPVFVLPFLAERTQSRNPLAIAPYDVPRSPYLMNLSIPSPALHWHECSR